MSTNRIRNQSGGDCDNITHVSFHHNLNFHHMMNPFDFSGSISFTCSDPDSSFVFEPAFNKFHWYGKSLDMLGKYMVVARGNQVFIELEYKYAREQVYTVVDTKGFGDALTTFVLKSRKTDKLYSFLRA